MSANWSPLIPHHFIHVQHASLSTWEGLPDVRPWESRCLSLTLSPSLTLCLSPSVSYLSVFLPVSLCVSLGIRLSLCFCLCLSPSVSVCLCPGQSSSRGLSFQLAMLSFFPFFQISVITRGVFPHHSFPRQNSIILIGVPPWRTPCALSFQYKLYLGRVLQHQN